MSGLQPLLSMRRVSPAMSARSFPSSLCAAPYPCAFRYFFNIAPCLCPASSAALIISFSTYLPFLLFCSHSYPILYPHDLSHDHILTHHYSLSPALMSSSLYLYLYEQFTTLTFLSVLYLFFIHIPQSVFIHSHELFTSPVSTSLSISQLLFFHSLFSPCFLSHAFPAPDCACPMAHPMFGSAQSLSQLFLTGPFTCPHPFHVCVPVPSPCSSNCSPRPLRGRSHPRTILGCC